MHLFLISIFSLVPSIALAIPVTMDFSSGNIVSGIGAEIFEYSEGGMTLTTYGTPSAYDNYFFTGKGTLQSQTVDGLGVVFTAADGSAFDVLSVDLYPYLMGTDTIPTYPHHFIASTGTILVTDSVGLFMFPTNGWTNLTYLTLLHDSSNCCRSIISLDNISFNVHSVPEPSALAFILIGVLFLLAQCRASQGSSSACPNRSA
jgi:hypothetical protein